MKNKLILAMLLLLSFAGVSAQDWSVVLNSMTGLPGVATSVSGGTMYKFTSPVYNIGYNTQRLRFIVLDTKTHEQPNGNNYCFALSELAVYDGEGN